MYMYARSLSMLLNIVRALWAPAQAPHDAGALIVWPLYDNVAVES